MTVNQSTPLESPLPRGEVGANARGEGKRLLAGETVTAERLPLTPTLSRREREKRVR